MSDEQVLTEDIAEQFMVDEDSTYFNGFTTIEDAAAQSLSKHTGYMLCLNGLTSLSDAAAESLSKHKGGYLNLRGLTSLSDEAAESLSKHQHVGICLSELPASAAQILRDAGHGHDGDE